MLSKTDDPRPDTELAHWLQRQWAQYVAACEREHLPEDQYGLGQNPLLLSTLHRVWGASQFVSDYCIRHPHWLWQAIQRNELEAYPNPPYFQRLQTQIAATPHLDEAQLGTIIRRFRYAEMVRIAWRDLAGWASLDETLSDLSHLADSCIQTACQTLYGWHCAIWGTPCNAEGTPQPLVVLGMGKLGAYELNFSSDIDLIFAYPEAGETVGIRSRSNEEFFRGLCQRLIQCLDAFTAEGFAYRVDTRLRPYGESGPLAMSFGAMETYYQVSGREWERYALIKARPVAGDLAQGQLLLSQLKPFIYRRYPDFSAFASLREMKAMIAREVKRKDKQHDIKLGSGGIREIEFIGQVFQLVQGGRNPALQQRPIMAVLATLKTLGLLPESVVNDLTQAYTFLRRLENRLQAYADQQTQVLPSDPLRQMGIALSLDYPNWDALLLQLNRHRAQVEHHFSQVFSPTSPTRTEPAAAHPAEMICHEKTEPAAAINRLQSLGFVQAAAVWDILHSFQQSTPCRSLSNAGRQRLERLLPLLIQAVAPIANAPACLNRLLELITVIAKRSTYLALLSENPAVLTQLVQLAAASPWIIKQLQQVPLLLDQLLDSRALYHLASRQELEADLARRLESIDPTDQESLLEALRHFKQSHTLSVAAVDVMGLMPLMTVSDQLTTLAEVILERVLQLARSDLQARYGAPYCEDDNGQRRPVQFAIIGYGKLGGLELGYGSDLDLVFLQDSQGQNQVTDGPQSVDNEWYFSRLVQRMIHYLNTTTHSGQLYEVDTRLRPNGQAGLLVSRISAFIDYQQHQAWTWEHQALIRARAIAGDPPLAQAFTATRHTLLMTAVKRSTLAQEVSAMRQRIRDQHKDTAPNFHLKHGAGGLIDIEFIVQYLLLNHAPEYPSLLQFSDNMRQLDALQQAGLLSAADTLTLQTAYREFRQQIHHLALQELPPLVPMAAVATQCQQVMAIWQAIFKLGHS